MDRRLKWLLVQVLTSGLLMAGASGEGGEECHPAKTCGKCMTINPMCSWCRDVNKTFEGPRCDLPANLNEKRCRNQTQETSTIKIVKNESLREPVYTNNDEISEEAIPIAPQTVNITLRLGDTHTIDVQVLQVNDYPVDLYYLMDLSNSMKDDLENLKTLGSRLAREMKNITRSFALGFGSFVDKPVLPYISIAPRKIDTPCTGCQKAYSFRNELSLNQNTTLFENKVKNTRISGNLDEAEGTLDAVMQAAVCKNVVGWREGDVRRLLLVTTDAPFHVEGDGKLGGILQPNDGECHLTDGEYVDAHLYDYPSVGQLNEKLIANNIIPIFAISGHHQLYEDVSHVMQGAIYSALSQDSSNIVHIVSTKYKEITGAIELAHTAVDGVELRISSNCSEGSDPMTPAGTHTCTNVHDGDQISFKVAITATRCGDQTFEIYPIGYGKRMTVNVKVVCNCSCEYNPDIYSTDCNGNGKQVCGICQCEPGRYGDTCECTGDSEQNEDQSRKDEFCKPNNSTKVLCSGRGECICGECRCNQPARQEEVVSGTFCECDNQACPREGGEVCGGSERGECVCADDGRTNICRCRPGYTGEKCNCPTQTDTCRASNGLICNAAGRCVCGKCECEEGTKYSGSKCDECLTCTECDRYIHCVQCQFSNNTESISHDDCAMCSPIIKNVTELPERNDTESACSFSDEDECSRSFVYEEAPNGTIVIYVKGDRDCAHSETIVTGVKVHLLILYIVLGIILIGLILILLFRLYTWHLDRVEYQQFLKEKENATWDKSENPLYQSSTQTVQNPAYGRGSIQN